MNKKIMDEAALRRAVMRISHEIIEKNKGTENIVLVGIKRRGIYLGEMIHDNIVKIEGVDVPFKTLDIQLPMIVGTAIVAARMASTCWKPKTIS